MELGHGDSLEEEGMVESVKMVGLPQQEDSMEEQGAEHMEICMLLHRLGAEEATTKKLQVDQAEVPFV
jgi:hypothetical protein